jgi:pimeloyl-ACP methyl ester carboxylesterase
MSSFPQALWLGSSPRLQHFHAPLITYLSYYQAIAPWEYRQNPDAPSSLDLAVATLATHLETTSNPIHLLGHSTGGLIGLQFARRYPEKVKSLTLLGVGVNPAVDWLSHYYTLRGALPCSSRVILARLAKNLFAASHPHPYLEALEKTRDHAFSPHSPYKIARIAAGGITKPLMIGGAYDDPIIPSEQLRGWKTYLKQGDCFWEWPEGLHFFHYLYPIPVGQQILRFWDSVTVCTLENVKLC